MARGTWNVVHGVVPTVYLVPGMVYGIAGTWYGIPGVVYGLL